MVTICPDTNANIEYDILMHNSKLFGEDCYVIMCHSLYEKLRIQSLQAQDTMRQTMVGSISHELRTPLNGLMILLGLAKNSKEITTEFYERYLKPSYQCADYLLNLINDILDYTQINFNKELRIVNENFNVKDYLSDLTDLLKMTAKSTKVKLRVVIDPSTPKVIRTEPRRLK